METEFTRLALFGIINECPERSLDSKLQFMENRVADLTQCPENEIGKLKHTLSYIRSDFKKKWVAAHNKEERFIINNNKWLEGTVKVMNYTPSGSGRPQKEFATCSERSKRRKTEEVRKLASSEELTYAAAMSHRAEGNPQAADLIKKVTETPTRAQKIKRILYTSAERQTVKKHSPSEALSIFVEADLTKNQYDVIQSANKNIYPCYSLIKIAKKECYPKEESIIVTETKAEVNLQDLLNHTSFRLFKYLHDVLDSLSEEEKHHLELIYKWGCDGSQQSQFKQKFKNTNGDDSNIFQSSLVPLQLRCKTSDSVKVIWQNPTPSSTRFCRPIRIQFIHENVDVTNEEMRYIESKIRELHHTEIQIENLSVKVKHMLLRTMVDGKVCNALTDTRSTMKCYICGKTSKDFNKLGQSFSENSESLKFGLSTLHARIRFFESLLHLSYKLPIKKWQARSAEEKKIVSETKRNIQDSFKKELGLLVDIPKQGFGNTNDGNTSRRFFENPESCSTITGVDLNLIKRLKVILEAISSGHKINCTLFQKYADETAKLYVELYGWYPMTPTLHKILVHGSSVISNALLPIGQLSEEAAEARNKHFRSYRQNFTRKFNREVCNRDILNRLLLSSDPFLSCSRKTPRRNSKPFSSETLSLLLPGTALEECYTADIEEMQQSSNSVNSV